MQGPPDDLPKALSMAPDGEVRLSPAAARAAEKRRAAQKSAAGWLIFVLVFGGGCAAAYAYRQQIVDYWPPAARLYTELGIKLRVLGEGLEIRNLNLSHAEHDGTPVLVVAGEIANTTGQAKDVPGLRGALLDSDKHELQHWIFTTAHPRLLPGEVASFESEVANPKPDAANISITFTGERPAP
jgi:hypothetical protein